MGGKARSSLNLRIPAILARADAANGRTLDFQTEKNKRRLEGFLPAASASEGFRLKGTNKK
jgi:hypothetical protein